MLHLSVIFLNEGRFGIMAGRLIKASRSPVIVIWERVPVKLNRACGGRDKHGSGFFEVENQPPKKRIKDDKMSVWSWWSIDRTYVPRQQLLGYIAYIQTLCLISALHPRAQTMFFHSQTVQGSHFFMCMFISVSVSFELKIMCSMRSGRWLFGCVAVITDLWSLSNLIMTV